MRQECDRLEQYCFWEAEQAEFQVGILGSGPGFASVLEILTTPEIQEFLPSLRLAGIAEPGPEYGCLPESRRPDAPVYASLETMLAAQPGINLLIELKGQKFKLTNIRQTLPPDVSLIDHASSFLLCGLLNMSRVSTHHRVDLDRQKALLQAIIDEVREDIILLNKEGRIIDMNKHVCERLGKTKDELLGLPCWEAQSLGEGGKHACNLLADDCPFHACLRSGKTAEALQTRVDSDGRLRYFRVYTYPIVNKAGELTHIVEMRRDITQRTMMEKQLLISEKLASIGETSTFLAHEIRNPLFAIGGFANSLLRSGRLDERDRQKVQVIVEESERLDRILKSIISFTKPLETKVLDVDVNALAREAVELVRLQLDMSGIKVSLRLAASLPKVRADEELFKQCLIGVLKNAVEAMPGGGNLTVTTAIQDKDVLIRIADTGHGIPDDLREKVFNPFLTSKEKGFGLGLAMTKKIVEDFGGHVELTSKIKKGTEVSIHLPPIISQGQDTERIDALLEAQRR